MKLAKNQAKDLKPVGKRQETRKQKGKVCADMSEEDSALEEQHATRPLDSEPDDFDEPLEKAPHYERSDRLDSAAGYLYEDTVEQTPGFAWNDLFQKGSVCC